MRTILIARHGQTKANVLDIYQGQLDNELTGLTEAGRQHAKNMARFCKRFPIEKIYSSPLRRAKLTAKETASLLKLDMIELDALKECCYGGWEGKGKEDLEKEYAEGIKEKAHDKYNFLHPGLFINEKGQEVSGESYAMVYERVIGFLKELENDKAVQTVLIVAHTGIVRVALKYFADHSERSVAALSPGHDQIFEVTIDGASKTVKTHNF